MQKAEIMLTHATIIHNKRKLSKNRKVEPSETQQMKGKSKNYYGNENLEK
jgi:hypothetical protein